MTASRIGPLGSLSKRRWKADGYRGASVLRDIGRQLRGDKLAITGAVVLLLVVITALFAPQLAPYDPTDFTVDSKTGAIAALQTPSVHHWLGTTNLGQDVFSQVIYGSRAALQVGVSAALLVMLIGTTVGLVAGYFGGVVDTVLMRIVDVCYSMPFESGALLLAAAFGPSTSTIILALALLMWQSPARVARAQTLSYVSRPSIKAARVAGASHTRIIVRHIAPNVFGVNVVYIPIVAGAAIVGQSTISFLGFGDPSVISWGSIMQLAFATGAFSQAWWWALSPGLAIVVTVAAILALARPFEVLSSPRLREI
jgi:peptide/nickel transport system permease protein